MILYHATTETKGKKILDDGFIKINLPSSFNDVPKESYINQNDYFNFESEKGYVYFSTRLSKAYDTIKATVGNNDGYIMIFKLNIPEDLLLPDFHEAKVQRCEISNLNESLTKCFSTRVNFDVDLKKYNAEYTQILSIHNRNEVHLDKPKETFTYIIDWVKDSHKEFLSDIKEKEIEFEKKLKWIKY